MKTQFQGLMFWIVLALAAVVWMITALKGHGYYHADEHYQIIEFAGLKLGTHTKEELAWEYHHELRSALLPTIAAGLLFLSENLGVANPYVKLQLLRSICGLLALLGLLKALHMFWSANPKIRKIPKWLAGLTVLLLWFIPFLGTRFSAESISGITLLLGITLNVYKTETFKNQVLAGILLGFSFVVRYQTGFAILGLLVWLLAVKKLKIRYIIYLAIGFLVSNFIGFLANAWFYEHITFPVINYVQSILNNGGSGFGDKPWYFYLFKICTAPGLPFGILFLLAFTYLLIKKPFNVWVFVFGCFVVAHSIVPHKELRFLFPLAFCVPFVLLEFGKLISNPYWCQKLQVPIMMILIILNTVGLVAVVNKTAGLGRMTITRHLHKEKTKGIQLIHTAWSNPYNPFQSLPTKYYLDSIQFTRIENLYNYHDSLLNPNAISYLVVRKVDIQRAHSTLLNQQFSLVKQSVPSYAQWLGAKSGVLDTNEVLVLYRKNES